MNLWALMCLTSLAATVSALASAFYYNVQVCKNIAFGVAFLSSILSITLPFWNLNTRKSSKYFHFILQVFYMLVIYNLSKLIYNFRPYPHGLRITIAILIFGLGNCIRIYFLHELKSKFASDERLQWHEDIIQLEKYFIKSRDGDESLSNLKVIEYIRCSNRKLDPKAYFCRFCDDPVMNSLADDLELLDILRSGYQREGVYLEGLTDAVATESTPKERQNRSSEITSDDEVLYTAEMYDWMEEPERFVELLDVSERDLKWLRRCGMLVEEETSHKSSKPMITYSKYERLLQIDKIKISGSVTKDSMELVLPDPDASRAYHLISRDFDTSLSFRKFKENMRQINSERTNLLCTMQNNHDIISLFDSTLLSVQNIITILFVICMFQNKGLFFQIISSIFIVFFPIAWNLISSFVFIVVTHPYDVGDRVYIDGENLIVKYVGLTYTVFDRWNNDFVVISNGYIRDHSIKNIRRSKKQQWRVEFYLSSKTSPEVLDKFSASLRKFVEKNPAFEHITIAVDDLKECHSFRVVFIIQHSINHQNGFFMWQVQNKFMTKLVEECHRYNLEYFMPERNVW